MSDEDETASQLTDKQKIEITKWFLLNSPAGEIQYLAKGNLGWMHMHVYIRMYVALFESIRNLIDTYFLAKMLCRYQGGFAGWEAV